MTEEYKLLDTLFDELFPIMRSISGPGIEKSMQILGKHIPLEVTKVPSHSKVFDWTVPQEWHFKKAILTDPNGKVICDASNFNLHVVNYSEAVNRTISLEELLPHIHSLPDLPDAVPYVTSYYSRTWGFCIAHNVKQNLIPGNYKVVIESEFKDGGVPYAQHTLIGESEKEVLLTSYLCHPSLANNELSGPLVLLGLYNRIKKWPKRRFSYRFLLNPETIGSLCFLHNHANELKENLAAGLILTCLGGPSENLLFKSSRKTDSLINNLMNYESNSTKLPINTIPFSPLNGSDERQFCAPGFNFPMGQISRTRYGQYDGYHNSLDTKEFMSITSIIESIDSIEQVLKNLEISGNPVNQSPFGEPQLGKRGLYPNLNSKQTRVASDDSIVDGRTKLNRILTILNMSDGETSLITIAKQLDCSINDLNSLINELEDQELIKYNVKFPQL